MSDWSDHGIDLPPGKGPQLLTTCPNCSHDRKKPNAKCLSVNIVEGVWLCHNCDWRGALGNGNGKHQDAPRAWKRPEPHPKTILSDSVLKWLLERKIAQEAFVRGKVSSRGDVAIFPYYRGGELINRKYRSVTEKKFWMEQDAERILWGLDDLKAKEIGIFCEGEIDKLSLETAGYLNVVSVPNGAPAVGAKDIAKHLSYLETAEAWLKPLKEIILAGDDDPPGIELREELARRLGPERCSTVKWPEGCKDANDVLVKHGADDIRFCVENRKPYPVQGIIDVDDLEAAYFDLYQKGSTRGLSTGWPSVDEFYTVAHGQLTTVTGYASSGKSNLIDSMMVNMAREHGWRFGVFSPENMPLEDHLSRMSEKIVGKPFGKGPTERMTPEDAKEGFEWVKEHFTWILPHEPGDWEIDNILNLASVLVFRRGIRGLVIDPWNELEHMRPQWMSETEYVSHTLKKIKAFCREKQVHVWLIAHPQKLYRGKDGKHPIPTLFDIAGSAHFRNKTDNGISIWRNLEDADSRLVTVLVQKIRFRQIGRIGEARLRYQAATATYVDTERDQPPRDYQAERD